MLQLTPNAARVITEVVADGNVAESGGLRIAATRRGDEKVDLGISVESAPTEGDQAGGRDA